jgi:hypothetical protein
VRLHLLGYIYEINEVSTTVPLAAIILGRDVLLSLSAFYIRYTSLPEPVGGSFISFT